MEYTIEDYKYDFIYYLSYLKNNSPNLYNINVKKLYEKFKKEYDYENIKNKLEFYQDLQHFYYNNLWNNGLYGHNAPFYLYITKDILNDYKHSNTYLNILKQGNILKKPYDDDMKLFIKLINKYKQKNNNKIIINKNKIYDTSIIKNDKNEDVIMIKIKQMIYPSIKEYNELYNFLLKNKDKKELYIDIRGNGGGNNNCYTLLYHLILNEKLQPKNNNIKCYFKYTKFNKPFLDYKIGDCKNKIIKSKNQNSKYTHYIIQKTYESDYTKFPKYLFKYKKDKIDFKGHIFIIIDHYCFSSAQMMLDESQGNNRFTILGDEKSGGFGEYGEYVCKEQYIDPSYFVLPKTKIICQMDLYYYNPKKYLTIPDKPIPKWLKKI